MTRSLALLIQIVIHALPAAIMGRVLERFVFHLDAEGPRAFALSSNLLVSGCFLASLIWCSLFSNSLLKGSTGAAATCAVAIPYTGALFWTIIAKLPQEALVLAPLFAIVPCAVFAFPVQCGITPLVARVCMRRVERRSSERDPFLPLLLLLTHALPTVQAVAILDRFGSFSHHPLLRYIYAAALLASGVWVSSLLGRLQSASAWRRLAASAFCGAMVPLFSLIVLNRAIPGSASMSLPHILVTAAQVAAFTIPVQALISPLVLGQPLPRLLSSKPKEAVLGS